METILSPHPSSLLAIEQLQTYLSTQKEWVHNFDLIGKMFGVLIAETPEKEITHLWGFSGKLANRNLFDLFVPPVFDTLAEDSFLSAGMKQLSLISLHIKDLEEDEPHGYEQHIQTLQKERKSFSIALQQQLFESYYFLNQAGDTKSLISIFKEAGYKNPPAGAGECAAPKLLQHAFKHQLKPLALTEFWWGQSPKSSQWKHGHFYVPCKEKCEPILAHMLSQI